MVLSVSVMSACRAMTVPTGVRAVRRRVGAGVGKDDEPVVAIGGVGECGQNDATGIRAGEY
jgi:hypothetical protein